MSNAPVVYKTCCQISWVWASEIPINLLSLKVFQLTFSLLLAWTICWKKIAQMSLIGDVKLISKFHLGYLFLWKESWKRLSAWVINYIDIEIWGMFAEPRDKFIYIALGNLTPPPPSPFHECESCSYLPTNSWRSTVICYVAYYYATKFKLPVEQTSTAKCGIRRSWKLTVKPNIGCPSNIAMTISYISIAVSSW